MKKKIPWIALFAIAIVSVLCFAILSKADIIHGMTASREEPNAAGESSEGGVFSGQATRRIMMDAFQTLTDLENAVVPENDYYDLAARLRGAKSSAEQASAANQPLLGSEESFWILDSAADEQIHVHLTLAGVSDHMYLWSSADLPAESVSDLLDIFENHMYPALQQLFGMEFNPGIDGDRRVYLLYTQGLNQEIAGYYSAIDSYPEAIQPYSNEHETIVINADVVALESVEMRAVLAHEFQHMIHWRQDRNETTWLNEGLSELAVAFNGYPTGGFDSMYLTEPDVSLINWPDDDFTQLANYGAAYLFSQYLLDQFGPQFVRLLVAEAQNGLSGIDRVLSQTGLDGAGRRSATDIFVDWTLANLVNDPAFHDNRYAYQEYRSLTGMNITEDITDCSGDWVSREVSQFGVDAIQIACGGDYELVVRGAEVVPIVPAEAHSGDFFFWSNRGDESDMRLTRQFDFSSVSGKLEMQFYAWYDLEEHYDYVYVLASEDGLSWEILPTTSGTDDNPGGNSYGWGYNGRSHGWQVEWVDLSDYAGKKVFIRFEYVTDAAVNGAGFLVDDIAIQAIGYRENFENGSGGWNPEGFARVQNLIPQSFAVSVVSYSGEGQVRSIDSYRVSAGDAPLRIGISSGSGEYAILMVSGTTRYTDQEGSYQFRLTRKND